MFLLSFIWLINDGYPEKPMYESRAMNTSRHDVHAALGDPVCLEAVGGSDDEGWDEIVDEG